MFFFSKSRYCLAKQCQKLLWLSKYAPELKTPDEALEARFAAGNEVGDLAMGLFGDFTEVTATKSDGSLDLGRMQELTRKLMAEGVENICEASFSLNGLYCAVDILRREGDGYAIYEVKSSTHPSHIYAVDIAYQKHVLEGCGVKVTGTYLVHVNSNYVRGDELDIKSLFTVVDMADEVAEELPLVPDLLQQARLTYSLSTEPKCPIGPHCRDPYECGFWDYCTKALPRPNVFDLYRMGFPTALKHLAAGNCSYPELLSAGVIKNKTQLRQIDHELNDRGDEVDKKGLSDFLDTLTYPLYFLDFESMQPVVPLYKNSSPYQQIPFQYSLHYIEREGGELCHKEFLAESGPDPRRALAERLCADIPRGVCVTAYNKSFECSRIKELAALFPDLAEHLTDIHDSIVDLLVPFRNGLYYNRAMGGSYSIKVVLPALFPDDPELDYHSLDEVHNGTEAMGIFPKLAEMSPEDRERTRKNLLEYCKLDTLAMVKLFEKLKEKSIAQEN